MKEIKEQLGFSELLKRIQIPKPITTNPCKEIPLAWDGTDWNGAR